MLARLISSPRKMKETKHFPVSQYSHTFRFVSLDQVYKVFKVAGAEAATNVRYCAVGISASGDDAVPDFGFVAWAEVIGDRRRCKADINGQVTIFSFLYCTYKIHFHSPRTKEAKSKINIKL